ncbi:MAG: signal recognition particle protein Srp54 [Phycisphaeraceae bacterium]|nr:signal recognition particle protein Srp54 [Phycisphaeraceae bacterium]
MFERLSDSFNSVFRKLSGQSSISESNVREAMQDVRTALLEADVHYEVVEKFCDSVVQEALGREVTKSLKPGQEMIGVVYDRLVEFLGGDPGAWKQAEDMAASTGAGQGPVLPIGLSGEHPPIMHLPSDQGPTVIMMCGLQGSGKTTTCGKLAAYLKKRGRSVMLVAADLQRPAAVEQLQTVGAQVAQDETLGSAKVLVHAEPDKTAEYGKAVGVAVQVCRRGVEEARKQGIDTVILDTAGRLHVNDALMEELNQVNKTLRPHQIFLIVDAMTGQDAVNSAKAFHERLEVDGIILTKFDSDTRGGAAISVKHVTGAPIKFIGVGEKLGALEEFHPSRIASRILGMGDVLSLVEKARHEVSEEEAEALQAKLAKGEMTMDDFLKQLRTIRRMGPLKQLLGLLPGIGAALKDVHVEDKQLDRIEAIVNSMNREERKTPDVLDNSRRKRIASGSGTSQNEVGQLAKQFAAVSKLFKQMGSMSSKAQVDAVRAMGAGAGAGLGGMGGFGKKGSSYTPSIKSKFKKRK